jgi:OOP family OmpA-OmpF porin
MTRRLPVLLPLLLGVSLPLTGCDRPAPPAADRAEPPVENAAAPANTLQARTETPAVESKSIMRPTVAEEMKPDPEPLKPETVTIGFPYDRSQLDDAARTALDRLLASPVIAAGARITLRGHSDTRGSDRGNHTVSARRAGLVAEYLADKGFPRDRMTIVAMGGDAPLVPNAHPDGSDDPEGRARNRRVEVTATPPAAIAAAVIGDAAARAPAPPPVAPTVVDPVAPADRTVSRR